MNWKVVVPPAISKAIGTFNLGRKLTVRLLTAIHDDITREYEQSRMFRFPGFEELYRFKMVIIEGEWTHTFRFAIDDSTAQGHLIIAGIQHKSRKAP